jgi:ligand-binding SRPBCC domain-containing protein
MYHSLDTEIRLPQEPEALFPFFSDAANLERITPPELGFSIVASDRRALDAGTLIRYRLKLWGVPFGWTTRISAWDPPHQFVDEQISGPFERWQHHHVLQPSDEGTTMHDHVDYALPLAPAGELAHRLVRRQLQRIFAYRHEAMLRLFSPGTEQPFIIDFDRDSHEAASPPLAEHAPAVPRTPSPLE